VLAPTASGKSDVAMAAAQAVAGTEIVAVDAMQVYRGMDIGTAKPTPADQAAVRHHGIDLVAPTVDFAVTDYVAAYDEAVATIAGRPLLVAGTGLYLAAVLDRLEVPGQWPEVRHRLDAEPDVAALWARLDAADPVAAGRIEPGNRRRIVRALEVIELTGRPFSATGVGLGHHGATMFPVRLFAVWLPGEVLTARIAARVDEMYAAGLVDEAKALAHRYPTGLSRTAGQAIGYREAFAVAAGVVDQDAARAATALRTRQFGRRQVRWFRRDPRITWFGAARNPADLGPALLECCRP